MFPCGAWIGACGERKDTVSVAAIEPESRARELARLKAAERRL
jgi:hypothetical protein